MSRLDLHGDFIPDAVGGGCGSIGAIIALIVGVFLLLVGMALLCDFSRLIGHCIFFCGCKG
jgi:hypothetical protein